MKLRRQIVWTLIVLIAAALISIGGTALAESPKKGGKLVVAFGADHRGMEPHYAIGWETLWLSMNLYSSLVGLNEKYEIVPEMAKSWEVSADGLTYTFNLHDNIFFHDGTKCDSECVKWNMERILDPNGHRNHAQAENVSALCHTEG